MGDAHLEHIPLQALTWQCYGTAETQHFQVIKNGRSPVRTIAYLSGSPPFSLEESSVLLVSTAIGVPELTSKVVRDSGLCSDEEVALAELPEVNVSGVTCVADVVISSGSQK